MIRKEEGREEENRVRVSVHGTRLVAHAVNLFYLATSLAHNVQEECIKMGG